MYVCIHVCTYVLRKQASSGGQHVKNISPACWLREKRQPLTATNSTFIHITKGGIDLYDIQRWTFVNMVIRNKCRTSEPGECLQSCKEGSWSAELVNDSGFAIVQLKFAWVYRMLRFKLGTVHLEFNGKMPLGLFSERLSFPKISWIFPTCFPVQQVWTANQLPLDWSLCLGTWSDYAQGTWRLVWYSSEVRHRNDERFVRPWLLCAHVRSRMADWQESQQDDHITEGHFEVIFCIPLPLNSMVVVRTANFEMELGRALMSIKAGNFEKKKIIVI